MFRVQLLQMFNSVVGHLNREAKIVIDFFEHPFAELAKQLMEIAENSLIPMPGPKWEYVVDNTTGLKILKSEKDLEALIRVRQLADKIFK